MTDNYLIELIEKYLDCTCTPKEKQEVEEWYEQQHDDALEFHQSDKERIQVATERSLAAIRQKAGMGRGARMLNMRRTWLKVAAAALILISSGVYFISLQKSNEINHTAKIQDIAPGSNNAVLTLANGNRVILNNAQNGIIATQGLISINKTADGQVVYESGDKQTRSSKVVYNTMATPKSGQYELMLSEGTKVWLNAASSIKYPVAFSGKERLVEITGEAYFEVAKDPNHPFIVKTGIQQVQVLGTHFNINSYPDEKFTKTTLLEGSVKIGSVILKPGQQAINTDRNIEVKKVNVNAVIDWKKGEFNFNDDDFRATMRKISRWYDVEIVYGDSAPERLLPGGWISRSKNITQVLKIMEYTGKVHFNIEGRRIRVTK